MELEELDSTNGEGDEEEFHFSKVHDSLDFSFLETCGDCVNEHDQD